MNCVGSMRQEVNSINCSPQFDGRRHLKKMSSNVPLKEAIYLNSSNPMFEHIIPKFYPGHGINYGTLPNSVLLLSISLRLRPSEISEIVSFYG